MNPTRGRSLRRRHGLHHRNRRLSRHPQAVWPKKDKGHDSPRLATGQQWCPFSSLTLSIACEGHGNPSAFRLNTGHRFQRSLAIWIHTVGLSGFSHFMPHISGQKIQPTQSHVWPTERPERWPGKKEPAAHCETRVHSRRGEGHAASCCPSSQSRGHTEPEGHSQGRSPDRGF